jgi:transposase-like protein
MRRNRSYTEEFRRLAVARMQGCHNISALAKELEVPRRLLYRWQMRLQGPVAPIAPRYPGVEEENRLLKQLLAERTLEVDFFQRCLAKDSGSTPAERQRWRDGIYDQARSMMWLQGGLTIERMCVLGPVNTPGMDGIASGNRARLGRARRLWRAHSRGRERSMARFAPQPFGTGPFFPISLSLAASRHPVCVTPRS